MVLYKRKQVTFVRPPPVPDNLESEIYIISQTKEWFLEYDEYLKRLDYYNTRKFVCEITGNSCLTFFEAYDSESKEIKDVESNFPEALREHILRFLQFNRISRLDQLVDKVYSVFKNDYFPGEEVYVKGSSRDPAAKAAAKAKAEAIDKSKLEPHPPLSSRKQKGTIREKVQYANPTDTKYLVSTGHGDLQTIATNAQISRDRNNFTKWLIKTFVKLTVTRSHKVGAPWVVKQKYAKKYRIPQEYPEDLKTFESSTPSGEVLYEDDLPTLKTPVPETPVEPAVIPKQKKTRGKSLKKKATINAATSITNTQTFEIVVEDLKELRQPAKDGPRKRFVPYHLPPLVRKELTENEPLTLSSIQPSKKTMINDLALNFDLQYSRPLPSRLQLPSNGSELQEQVKEALQSDIKDDEADAKEEEKANNNSSKLAALHKNIDFMSKELQKLSTESIYSVQEALECWAFLNIYHSVLKLDTFTFDDFICAMSWTSDQYEEVGRCPLLDEIWCAVLCALITNDVPTQRDIENEDDDRIFGLQVNLPPRSSLLRQSHVKDEDDDLDDKSRGSDSEEENKTLKSEDDASENESDSGSTSPKMNGNGTKQSKKANSSREAKSEEGDEEEDTNHADSMDENKDEDSEEEEEEEVKQHLAHVVMNYRGTRWLERLRKRNFKDGNWQTILLGALSLVDYVPDFQETIESVFRILAPIQVHPATPNSVLTQFYTSLSLDLRIRTLHILTSLLVNSTLVRNYIDECLDVSTNLRRSRLDTIRDFRSTLDAANKTHTLIFEKLMEAYESNPSDEVWASFSKKRSRFKAKIYVAAEYEKRLFDADADFKKLWQQRDELITKILELKEDKRKVELRLSEIDCQRVRLLGRDRFYNRYWWFENNGLPNLHYSTDPDEEEEADQADTDMDDEDEKNEIQEESYLMGRLWVQGPSKSDITSKLHLSDEELSKVLGRPLVSQTPTLEDIKEEEEELEEFGPRVKVMHFDKIATEFQERAGEFGIKFDENRILVDEDKEAIDRLGAIPESFPVTELKPAQRKFIEEAPEPLFGNDQWRYYDDPQQIEKLITWVNPWGIRESNLRKELLRVKDGLLKSMEARRKALWIDKIPKEEGDIEGEISEVSTRLHKLESGEVSDRSDDEEDNDISTKKRRARNQGGRGNKRQKTTEEIIKTGSLSEVSKLYEDLKQKLVEKRNENRVNRVLEWVNSTAKESFDKTLYEGGGKPKAKPGKKKKQ